LHVSLFANAVHNFLLCHQAEMPASVDVEVPIPARLGDSHPPSLVNHVPRVPGPAVERRLCRWRRKRNSLIPGFNWLVADDLDRMPSHSPRRDLFERAEEGHQLIDRLGGIHGVDGKILRALRVLRGEMTLAYHQAFLTPVRYRSLKNAKNANESFDMLVLLLSNDFLGVLSVKTRRQTGLCVRMLSSFSSPITHYPLTITVSPPAWR